MVERSERNVSLTPFFQALMNLEVETVGISTEDLINFNVMITPAAAEENLTLCWRY